MQWYMPCNNKNLFLRMNKYKIRLQELIESHNYRQLPDNNTLNLIDLCSNDYLGINENAALRKEFLKDINMDYTFGAASSRLLSKSLEQHLLLEKIIAKSYNTEAALIFNSGYHANVGILSALPGNKDLIIADKLIHASIIDGAKLSNADFMRYKHLDYEQLELLLKKHRKNYDKVFIVSESIFSMDGDVADLPKMIELKNKYTSYLYIDEAHALGVRGRQGLGCLEEFDCMADVDFIVGTMGKAMASVGAFVACKQLFIDYLINHSRAFIFSTALPPINMAWSKFVFQQMKDMNTEREYLKNLSTAFSARLNVQANSHIIPFLIGDNSEAIAASQLLKKNGFNVLPIRYPTVPKNTARLRFSLSANMKLENLKAIETLLINETKSHA